MVAYSKERLSNYKRYEDIPITMEQDICKACKEPHKHLNSCPIISKDCLSWELWLSNYK